MSVALAASGGRAAAEARLIQGQQLVLTDTLSSHLVIGVDPTLSGQVRVSANGPVSCVSAIGGQTAVIGTGACNGELDEIRIDVSPNMAVTLEANGSGSVQMGDLRAQLTATMNGSADLQAGRVGGLALSVNGGGDVSVGAVEGPASLQMTGGGDVRVGSLNGLLSLNRTGSGDLAIGKIDAPSVDVQSEGSGDAIIGSGRIGVLHARLSGSGDLAVAATVAGGAVAASGGADIKLGEVTGALSRSASGGSDIMVGGSAVVTEVIGQAARAIGQADVAEVHSYHRHSTAHGGSSTAADVFHVVLVAIIVFVGWRILRRSGWLRGRTGATPADAPLNPGVFAVGEILSRLDQRLGRLEGYVTTREFELNRKFRDLR